MINWLVESTLSATARILKRLQSLWKIDKSAYFCLVMLVTSLRNGNYYAPTCICQSGANVAEFITRYLTVIPRVHTAVFKTECGFLALVES